MNLNKNQKLLIAAVCLILFALVKIGLLFVWQQQKSTIPATQLSTCEVTKSGCEFQVGQRLQLIGVGSNKTPFTAKVTGLPENIKSVNLSFEMRDMAMGFNRFELKKQADNSWQVDKIYLPLCSSNRHDWQVKWRIDGQEYQAEFQTLP